MEKINLPFFYQVGGQLNPLTKMRAGPQNRVEIFVAGQSVRNSVVALLNWGGGLKVCYQAAKVLLEAIDETQKWVGSQKSATDWNKVDVSTDWMFQQLIEKAKNFETVLSEELLTLSAYWATQKGIYSTSDLIDHAERVFPPSVLDKLSESVTQEVAHGGRCLAFDVPTAAGFHMLRATEAVLYEYYIEICKPTSKKKLENWGAYISALFKLAEKTGIKNNVKDHVKRVLALLQQVKDQDRNVIMHPEVVLTINEAFILFEITKSAIMAMSDKLPELKKKETQDQKPSVEVKK